MIIFQLKSPALNCFSSRQVASAQASRPYYGITIGLQATFPARNAGVARQDR
jgi:hypothetical protein